jgi:hypothetical protein
MNAHPPATVTVASDTRDVAEMYRRWIVLSDQPTRAFVTEQAAFAERDRLHALGMTHVEVRVVSESRVTDIPQLCGHFIPLPPGVRGVLVCRLPQGHDGEHRTVDE